MDERKEAAKGRPIYPRPTKPWWINAPIRLMLRLLYRIETSGWENIPREGPVLFAPNHDSYLDPTLVNCMHDHPMNFMARDDLFGENFFGRKIRECGAFPVSLDRNDPAAYRMALASLRDGNWLVLFPEGGRSFDGSLQPLREGVARLALKAGSPVVPVRIDGAFDVWPRSRKHPKPWGKLRVTFKPAMTPPELPPGDVEAREQAVQAIMEHIRKHITPAGPWGETSGRCPAPRPAGD